MGGKVEGGAAAVVVPEELVSCAALASHTCAEKTRKDWAPGMVVGEDTAG
jgi:hypothetical protein